MANKIQKLKNSTNDTIYPVTVKDAIYDNSGNPLSIADTASVVAVDAKVGDLSLLTTTNKTSAVNAINEVDSDVTSLVNTVNGINSNINVVDNKIGILSALQTIDKTDVVSAINENSSAIGQNTHDISQISHPNLLINGDFQVWQRGTSFTSGFVGGVYTADRWRVFGNEGSSIKVEKVTDGMKITAVTSGAVALITQKFEANLKTFLNGKKVTFSAEIDGVTVKNTYTYGSGDAFDISYQVLSAATAGNSTIIKNVKLELGEISTPFSPRPIAEELLLCQRYCATSTIIGLPYLIDTNEIRFFIPLQRFRTTPSLIVGDMAVSANSISQSGFTFDNVNWASNGIYLRAYKVNHGLTSKIVLTSITAIFDAEIY